MSLQSMQNNIEHVVHLMLENRSFDSLLGWLRWNGSDRPPNNVPLLRPGEKPFYGLDGTQWQPSDSSFYTGPPYTYTQENIFGITNDGWWDYCEMPASDPGEEFEHVYQQIYGTGSPASQPVNKTMMGFYIDYLTVYSELTSASDILAVFMPETLPVLNTLAENFAVSDMWFSSVPTQTNPNRAFSLCGTSLGRINNNADPSTYKLCGEPYVDINTIFSVFNAFNKNNPGSSPVTWKLYADYNWHDVNPSWTFYADVCGTAGQNCFDATQGKFFTQYMFPRGFDDMTCGACTGSIDDFLNDITNDTLPSFSYIEPTFFPQTITENTDYHPPESVFDGETFVAKIFQGLNSNPTVWNKTLFIITFDEHGGTYDHILPPSNAIQPDDHEHVSPDFDFTRYGVRVPTLLISPWVTPGTVFRADYYPKVSNPTSLPFDHTSVLATLCQWKGIDYQDEQNHPDYYLGARTASAPLFVDAITDSANNVSPPNLTPHDCSVGLSKGMVRRSELIAAISCNLTKITGIPTGTALHKKILDEIFATCKSEEDLKAYFDYLALKAK